MLEGKTELPTVEEKCGTCRFWFDEMRDGWAGDSPQFEHADCRRFPPRALLPGDPAGGGLPTNRYPSTVACDWCGEWRAKMEETAETPQQSRKQKKLERLIAQIPQATAYILWQIVHDTTREPALREAAFRELVARKSPPPA